MSLKPLPFKAQLKGKKLSVILSAVFGLIFAGALGAFIGLTVSKKEDSLVTPFSSSATTLKDTSDGLLYSTADFNLVYTTYEHEVVSAVNINDKINEYFDLGKVSTVGSVSYVEETGNIYLVAEFNKNGAYSYNLVKFNKDNENNINLVPTAGFTRVENPITALEESNGFIYAIIRDSSNATINKFNANDLTTILDSGYLYRTEFSLSGKNAEVVFNYDVNDVIYSIHIENDYIHLVCKNGVISVKNDCFSHFPRELGLPANKTVKYDTTKPSDVAKYEEYIYSIYSYENNEPRGAFEVGNECYFITKSMSMAHFSFDDLELTIPEDDYFPEVYEEEIDSVKFNASAPDDRTGLFYNETAKKAAVITSLGNTITLLDLSDLENINILFTDTADISITDVVISNSGKKVYYLCQNKHTTNDFSRMLKLKDVDDVYTNIGYGKITPALLTIAFIFCFLFVIAICCGVLPMFLEKFIEFLKNFKRNWVAYLILSISLTLLGMFCYYPATGSISMSFFNYKNNEPVVWNNFENYKTIFKNPEILKSFGNMLIFLVFDVITAILPPLIFAFFLTVMKNKKISAVTRTLLFLPSVIPGITKMMIWQNGIYGEYGVINRVIQLFKGNPVIFFSGTNFDIWALILMGFPYVGSYLVFYGAFMNIPGSYYEAAELEGLNVWKRFFKIDIPLIKPQIKYVVILTIIASVQNFGRTYMINSSLFTVRTPIHIMYDYINKGNYGLSSAIATILFVLLLIFTIFNMKKQKAQLGDSI